MFDQIEKLKRKYTDQYVVVDDERPELARFAGYTGQVKTVNMSGRALVQFEAWNNIGWYDIDVSFLTLVPKPEAGAAAVHAKPAAAKPVAAKPAEGAKKVSAAELARAQGAAKPAGAAPAAGKKASTADILAAARAAKASGAAPATPAAKPAASAEPTASSPDAVLAKPHVTHEVGPEVPLVEPARLAAAAGPKPTTTAEKIAWCRQHDAHS